MYPYNPRDSHLTPPLRYPTMPLNTLTGLLTHPVGPGGCPAADLLLGAVSLDLYLRGMRPPNFLTPEAKARAAETDTLTKRMIRVDLTTTRGRLIHQGFRTAPCFVQLFALWLKGWKGVEGFKGGLQFRKLFWCANIAILTGSALRLWCFRILGQYFTFELAVRDGQKVSGAWARGAWREGRLGRLTDYRWLATVGHSKCPLR